MESRDVDVQGKTLNFLSASELKKFLEVADRHVSDDAKKVINYLIKHNSTYMKSMGTGENDNVLIDFLEESKPEKKEEREVWNALKSLNSSGRLLEVPTFLTQEQYDAIVNEEMPVDEVIMNLSTEEGRNKAAEKWMPLVYKVAHMYSGKCNLSFEDLVSAGLEGLVNAINKYGKNKGKKFNDEIEQREEEIENEIDELENDDADDNNEKRISDDKDMLDVLKDVKKSEFSTFKHFAWKMVQYAIISDIRDVSRNVRIPISAQRKLTKKSKEDPESKDYLPKNNCVSGDFIVGKDEDKDRTLFDTMHLFGDSADLGLLDKDIEAKWKEVYAALDRRFDKKTMFIFYSTHGLNGYEKMSNKELAKKYGVVASDISYYTKLVFRYIMTDEGMQKKFSEIHRMTMDRKHEMDDSENQYGSVPAEIVKNV